MKNFIPDWKTNITIVVLALIPILGMFGIVIDPDTAVRFINEFFAWLIGGETLLAALGVWFRQLGKRF